MIRIASSLVVVGVLAGCSAADEPVDSEAAVALSEDYRAYADFARSEGADPAPGGVTVIGLRGLSIDGKLHPTTYADEYDDTLVVLRKDGTVERFPGATHPHHASAAGPPDVNGDAKPDVGMIKPGVYDIVPREALIAGMPSYPVMLRGTGKLPGWRDTNHDGVLDEQERAASDRRGDYLTAVLFHQGEGGAPPAIGCQVLPASAMRAFVAAIGGPRAKFRYVLVDMAGRDPSDLPR
jgi:hypothetical protein